MSNRDYCGIHPEEEKKQSDAAAMIHFHYVGRCHIVPICTVSQSYVAHVLPQLYSTPRGKTGKLEEPVNRELNVTRS